MKRSLPTRYDSIGNGYLSYYEPHDVHHPGVDFNWGPTSNADLDQPIVAPEDGVVEYVSSAGHNGGLGLYLVLHHPNSGVWTRYLHTNRVPASITAGRAVKQGQEVARVGKSGTLTPHLHFEVLNAAGLAFVRDWSRPYGRYPSKMARPAVAAMFLDPIAWLNEEAGADPEQWKKDAEKWAKESKIIAGGWDRPDEPMSQVRVAAALKNLYELLRD